MIAVPEPGSTARLRECARAAAAQIRHELLCGPAQLRSGPQAGGVAGVIDADGVPAYVYGEITGYWLHWLAGLPGLADTRRLQAAQRAAAWCARTYASDRPVPTRIALHADAPADWRNAVEFCFDLAMLVGGLSAAASAGLIAPPRDLLRTLLGRLQRCTAGAQLHPLLRDDGAMPGSVASTVPARWSTRPGPFLLKAAARIRRAAIWVDVPAPLWHACGMAGAQSLVALRVLDDPLHPSLYALEGAWALGAPLEAIRTPLATLLALQDAEGFLPETPVPGPGAALRRSDVVAQALRLLLGTRGCGTTAHPREPMLVRALLQCVMAQGQVVFTPPAPLSASTALTAPANVWCAMFAEQALRGWADPGVPMTAETLV